MLKARAAIENSWETSSILGKSTQHKYKEEKKEGCNFQEQYTLNTELPSSRKVGVNMCYLEGGMQDRKKNMWKVAQVWESSDFQKNQRENASLHWILYSAKQHPLTLRISFSPHPAAHSRASNVVKYKSLYKLRSSKCLVPRDTEN